jgi:hypothetical protein
MYSVSQLLYSVLPVAVLCHASYYALYLSVLVLCTMLQRCSAVRAVTCRASSHTYLRTHPARDLDGQTFLCDVRPDISPRYIAQVYTGDSFTKVVRFQAIPWTCQYEHSALGTQQFWRHSSSSVPIPVRTTTAASYTTIQDHTVARCVPFR